MQWGVCVEILVETILRLEGTVQGLASVVGSTVSGTQALFTVSGLLHGVRMIQQVIVGVEMVVIAKWGLLLRMVLVLATSGIGWSRVLPVDHLVALICIHLVTEVCGKRKRCIG